MSIGSKIKALRESAGLSQIELGKIAGVTDKAVSTWENDLKTPRMGAIQAIADYFRVPKSYIVDDEVQEDSSLNTRDQRDIAKDLESFKDTLENGEGLMFDGDPMSDEAKASILAAIETGLRMVKVMNKDKYTPKKYKKD